MSEDARLGAKVRALRRRESMSQAKLAQSLEISPSYLNLIEHDLRPLSAPLLIKLVQLFHLDLQTFTIDNDIRLRSELMEAFGDPIFEHYPLTNADVREMALGSPVAAKAGLLTQADLLEALAQDERLTSEASRVLGRVTLANYFAGAVLMPYLAFLEATREVRYDIELLGIRFGVTFEQICHRLTSLRRPGAEGIPFHFVRVDTAGNISKRFSASGIQISRFGSCPRWNLHESFLTPGRIITQLSQTPDGATFFCLARTVTREARGYHIPKVVHAIALGCKVRDARAMVYADGVDLENLEAAVPIGTTCRICPRMNCEQRACPPLHQALEIDPNQRGITFYAPTRPDCGLKFPQDSGDKETGTRATAGGPPKDVWASMELEIQITDNDLPVLSAVATQALELIQNENVTNAQVEQLIRQDPALTERVLHTANSPFYGGRQQSTTITNAVFRLGLRQLRNVVAVAAAGELFDARDATIQALWNHLLAVALTAHTLAERIHFGNIEEVFIAGMMHDVGKLVIYRQHPLIYRAMIEEVQTSGRLIQDLENERFRYFNHMSVGGLVLRKWRLADAIAEAARFHHDVETTIPKGLKFKDLDSIVALANVLVNQPGFMDLESDWDSLGELACARQIQVTPAQLREISRQAAERIAAERPVNTGC